MNKYLIIIALLILSSCCDDPVQTDEYLLSMSEKEKVPYSLNDISKFTYTNGFEFDMEVIKYETSIEQNFEEYRRCKGNYSLYEKLFIRLASNVPEFQFDIYLVPEIINTYIEIKVNDYNFSLMRDSIPDFDTLTLNGYLFNDVFTTHSYYTDSLRVIPKEILYTKENGIIQIIMTDNEKFTLKK